MVVAEGSTHYKEIFLASILKNTDKASYDVIKTVVNTTSREARIRAH